MAFITQNMVAFPSVQNYYNSTKTVGFNPYMIRNFGPQIPWFLKISSQCLIYQFLIISLFLIRNIIFSNKIQKNLETNPRLSMLTLLQ